MTKKDFFRIIIKLFGLYSIIISLFTYFPNNISFATSDTGIEGIIWFGASLAIVISLFVLLLFKTDTVIHLLKLDKGFDEDRIHFENLNPDSIVMLGSIIIGGFLLIDNLSDFLSYTLFAFKYRNLRIELNEKDKLRWAISFINTIIGYLILTNYKVIAKLLKTKDKE